MLLKVNWQPNHTEIRKFGGVLIIGFALIGTVTYWRGRFTMAEWIWGISGVVGLWSILVPGLAKSFYWLWMGIGYVMGSVVSRVVLVLIFYGILTPLAVFFRCTGRDPLHRFPKTAAEQSYWMKHPDLNDKKSYEHLF